jgi:hypothetical protein
MFLILLIGFNVMVVAFSYSIGIDVEFSDVAPSEATLQSSFRTSGSSSIGIVDTLLSLVTLPIDIATSILKQFGIVYDLLFGYEKVFENLNVPLLIIDPILAILRTFVLVIVLVTTLDMLGALKGVLK